MKIVARNELQYSQLKNAQSGELYSLSSLASNILGSQQLVLICDKIAPQKKASSAHRHSQIEEIIYISKGSVTVICGSQKKVANEGSFIFFNPKDSDFHYLTNETESEAETITFSVNRKDDSVVYQNDHVWQPPTIETSRLILRAITANDANSIFAYAKNPQVCRYTLWEAHQSVQDSLNYITDYVLEYYSKGVPEPLGIALKEEPERIIGTAGCFWTSRQAKAMELAYALSEEHWGKGLVAEASEALMNYCFQEFKLKRIQARCKVENQASRRVMEKIGMTYEGTLKSATFHRNKFWDMSYYAKVVE